MTSPGARRGRDGRWAFEAVVESVQWGRSAYTVLWVPDGLAEDARSRGTRRVSGTIEGEWVNLAINRASEFPHPFMYAGASLLRRIRAEPGEPVSCLLAPEDPDAVHVPADVEAAIDAGGVRDAWEALTPADRRRKVYTVESARTATTRERRVAALVHDLITSTR
ncbi:MAG: YdeI/OmpD-associated family protein [Dermatophilaceae bacterium]